jgi:F-type H+-transporting ATPase subunit epsilon
MAAFHFEMVSPEKLVFSGEVESVTVPGTEGEFTVFKDHAPVISSLKPGIVVKEKPPLRAWRLRRGGAIGPYHPRQSGD